MPHSMVTITQGITHSMIIITQGINAINQECVSEFTTSKNAKISFTLVTCNVYIYTIYTNCEHWNFLYAIYHHSTGVGQLHAWKLL